MTDLEKVVTQGVASVLAQALGKKALDFLSHTLRGFREAIAGKFFPEVQSMIITLGLENPRQVPPKIWYPIIDNGTLEDDEFLRTKYAALLVNALDPNFEFGIRPSFVEILKQLTATEAKLLDHLYANVTLERSKGWVAHVDSTRLKTFVGSARVSQEELILILNALERHRLLEMTAHPQTYVIEGPYGSVVQLNRFGSEFVAACRAPSPKKSLD